MLAVRNVSKKFGKASVLSDVSFEVSTGQAVLLVGGSGSGKSVLLDCIAGVSSFDGIITVSEIGCRSFGARRSVGYLRDPLCGVSSSVNERLSADDHIEFIRRAYELDDSAVKYASSLFSAFGLADCSSRPLRELPALKRRLCELVIVLSSRPKLILLDRPEVGLDHSACAELEACILSLKLKGCAFVIAVQDTSEIGAVWDTAFEFDGGRIIGTMSAAESVCDEPAESGDVITDAVSEVSAAAIAPTEDTAVKSNDNAAGESGNDEAVDSENVTAAASKSSDDGIIDSEKVTADIAADAIEDTSAASEIVDAAAGEQGSAVLTAYSDAEVGGDTDELSDSVKEDV